MRQRSMRAGAIAVLAATALLCGPSVASAQTPNDNFYVNGRHYSALDYYLDGPPDTPGCPRNCARDLSPCDPPLYKKADGRCKNSDGN